MKEQKFGNLKLAYTNNDDHFNLFVLAYSYGNGIFTFYKPDKNERHSENERYIEFNLNYINYSDATTKHIIKAIRKICADDDEYDLVMSKYHSLQDWDNDMYKHGSITLIEYYTKLDKFIKERGYVINYQDKNSTHIKCRFN